MNGSKNDDVQWTDLINFACDEADEETQRRVRAAFDDPEHPIAYLLSRTDGKRKAPSQFLPASEPDLEAQIEESANADIKEYLTWEQARLEESLVSMLPDEQRAESELAYRSGNAVAWSVLQSFLPQLRQLVRDEWDWPSRDAAGEFPTEENVASALAVFLAQHGRSLPFRPNVLAVSLVRLGLSRLCGQS